MPASACRSRSSTASSRACSPPAPCAFCAARRRRRPGLRPERTTIRPMVLDSTSAMTHVEPDRWHSPRHAAVVAGFSAVVALGLVIAKGGDWILQFVYAEAIGLSIWACTDFGRLLFKRDP